MIRYKVAYYPKKRVKNLKDHIRRVQAAKLGWKRRGKKYDELPRLWKNGEGE